MKRIFIFFIVTTISFAISAEAADVGVSISVGQPGFYGHIDIGNFPQPQVIYPRPIVIRSVPGVVTHEPLYLRVPPGHEKKWKKHCQKYNACERPVYFIRDQWYNNVYVPEYQARHGHKGGGYGDNRGGGQGDQGGDRGKGKGHGKGRDKD
jgi:hypothetical protein